MSINLDELSVDELEKLIKQAESALDKKQREIKSKEKEHYAEMLKEQREREAI